MSGNGDPSLKLPIIAAVVLLFTPLAFGQQNRWTLFTDADGLPSNTISVLGQDRLGYLWIATRAGICKHDGRDFQEVSLDASTNPGEILDIFFDDRGRALCVYRSALFMVDGSTTRSIGSPDQWKDNPITVASFDKRGRIWIGTRKGIFSFGKDSIRAWGESDGIPEAEVSTIFEDRSGFLWVGFRNSGVALAQESDTPSWKLFTTAHGLPQNVVNDVAEDRSGTIWVATLGGIARFVGGAFVSESINDRLPSKNVLSLLETREGARWLRLRAGGLARLSQDDIRFFNTANGLPSNSVLEMIEDRNGRLWLATRNGIASIRNDSVTVHAKTESSIPTTISTVFEDREGLIWFGTTEGLLRYDEGRFETPLIAPGLNEDLQGTVTIASAPDGKIWFATPAGVGYALGKSFKHLGSKDGIPNEPIQGLTVDDKGILWLWTDKNLFQEAGAKFRSVGDMLKNRVILEVAADKFGRVWLLTRDDAVFFIEQGSVKTFNIRETLDEDVTIRSLEVDQFGTVWMTGISTLYRIEGSKVSRFHLNEIMPKAGSWNSFFVSKRGVSYFTTDKGLSVLSGGRFTYFSGDSLWNDRFPTWIYEDSSGHVWTGVWSFERNAAIGVAYFNGKSIQFFSGENVLPSNDVTGAFSDRLGSVWLMTNRGVAHFDGTRWTTYGTDHGLAGNVVRKILKGNDGSLWFITLGGISRFNGTTFSKLTRKDGLLHPSIEDAVIDRENNLWVATRYGVQRVNPVHAPPMIHIASIKTNEGVVSGGSPLPPMEGASEFTFHYRGLSFRSGQKRLLYFYRLVGYDNNWHGPVEQTSVSYFNLDPGDYRFIAKCVDADLVESNEAAVSFTIFPPFWRTTWFAALAAVTFFGFLYGGFRFRTHQLEKKSQALADMVRQRTEELLIEQRRSEELLNNILPVPVVRELKEKGSSEPREYRSVTILFTDFMGFTNVAGSLPADRLVGELNEVFKEFDEIIEHHGIEKLKTIGDAYLIASGLPTETPDHAVRAVMAALHMQSLILKRNETSPYKWNMRAGIHSGQVVAGIVGKKKFTYDVWGDTVNIASRMESSCIPGRVNISAFTYDLVKEVFDCEYRGKIDAKGKGSIDMYLVVGVKSTNPTASGDTTRDPSTSRSS